MKNNGLWNDPIWVFGLLTGIAIGGVAVWLLVLMVGP